MSDNDNSLFERLGGEPAVDAAVDLFYRKVLGDDSIKRFFRSTDMDDQRAKQKAFLTMAFGGPNNYSGKDLTDAHARLVDDGLNDSHFDAVAGHLNATLKELGVPDDLIGEAMAIAASTRDDVLGKTNQAEASEEGNTAVADTASSAAVSDNAEVIELHSMLDSMPINVMMADPNTLELTYLNKASKDTFKAIEALLPISADEVLGSCIDIFHADASHQRGILADASNLPISTHIKLGDETLDLLVSPVFDGEGNYTNAMATWSIISEKVKADAESDRLQQMVENMPINVMMADPQTLELTYLNKSSRDTFKAIEHLLPVKAEDVLGSCIDVFHKDPAHQRSILTDASNLPVNSFIKLGDETLDLAVSAVNDKNGNYIAAMATWSIVTEKVKADAEADRLRQMVENMPINVMMADPQTLELNYLNKSSRDTFKAIEHLLPVKADDVLGSCIDIFHKDPAHQRSILTDASNLPVTSFIKLGEETLDLAVSAVNDKDGNYIAAMATWSIVTEKVKADAESDRLQQMVENMPINVMMADPETLELTYLNKSSRDTFKSIEHLLPVKSEDVLGSCIDIFHKDPSHQRKILRDSSNLPVASHIMLGSETLDLAVSAVNDKNGNYIAAMATWSVITEKVKADAESVRLQRMIEEMPINVMMADRETLELTYINRQARETLKSLQHLLPVNAEELLGQCIDIFHQDPSLQRRLLADVSNLPHSAKISLGDETLRLDVSAVIDASGNYIGPMVAWSVITGQVRIATNVSEVVDVVASAATELKASAESMVTSAEQTASQSTAVAAASEEVTSNVQTVSAAAEQLSSSVNEISRQVAESTRISEDAVAETDRTNEVVQGLAEAAQKIGDVVKLISDIAGQTNLLALNATIEAARAGEAGKGFAVVASEVKSLANQTAKATEDIAAQVGNIQSATNDAVGAIKGVGETINKLSEIATSISSAVEEQGAATGEISRNVQEAANGTQEVTGNITQVSTNASESGQSASQVLSAADGLSEEAEKMRTQITEFLDTI
jgi:methyl-accepting chemotaxis protein